MAARGLPVALVVFAGEGHGFRRAENIRRALEGELDFYGQVFGFSPYGEIEPVTIEEVRVTLGERLSSLEIRSRRRRFGAVFAGPIEEASGRSFRVVFVPGLVDEAKPPQTYQSPRLNP